MSSTKASIIFNPNAGKKGKQKQIKQVAQHLEAQGWQITLCKTSHAGHATQLASEANDNGQDIVIAAGGGWNHQ